MVLVNGLYFNGRKAQYMCKAMFFYMGTGLWMYHEGDEHIPSSEEYTQDNMRILHHSNLRRTLGWLRLFLIT